jgi:hypothetical protein
MRIDFDKLVGGDSMDALVEPRKIFATLPNKVPKYSYLRDVQSEVLDAWFARRDESDLVLKMNTGAGKTVVGLLVLQSCVNEKKGPAVYVVPDHFLCDQVCFEAGQLGIPIVSQYSSLEFKRGEAILVIPIHTLINGKSAFGVGQTGVNIRIGSLLIDDAHACLATAEGQFTMRIPSSHAAYTKLLDLFAQDMAGQSQSGLLDLQQHDPRKLMLVPFWAWADKSTEVLKRIHPHREEDEFKFVWPLLAENLSLCQCFFTGAALEISSRCLPIEQIPSFVDAQRRLYMTATLADDSVLVTDFNVRPELAGKPVTPKSAGDLGDRMILTPQELNPNVKDEEIRAFVKECSRKFNVVVITPSDRRAAFWKDEADKFLNKENLHEGVEQLKKAHVGLVILSNKYDGIDLPYNACRLLVLDGLPEVRRFVDRYEQSVLNDGDGILSRQMQRIEQGMGRGVRANDDYCVVMIMGSKLTQALFSTSVAGKFSPATTAQMKLSNNLAKQIRGKPLSEMHAVIALCLTRNPGWVKASKQALVNVTYDGSAKISEMAVVQRKAFGLAQLNQFRQAAETIQGAANAEQNPKMRGWLKQQIAEYVHRFDKPQAQELLLSASMLNRCLIKPLGGITYTKLGVSTIGQALRAETFLSTKFNNVNEIVIWLHGLIDDLNFYEDDAERFEKAMALLGLAVGFETQRPEIELGKGPDDLWGVGGLHFLVIECKNGAKTTTIAKKDADQLGGSIIWFRAAYDKSCHVTPVLVHPALVFDKAASPIPDVRIVEQECLAKIRAELLSYAAAVGALNAMPTADQLQGFFAQSSFTREKFASNFTKAPKRS